MRESRIMVDLMTGGDSAPRNGNGYRDLIRLALAAVVGATPSGYLYFQGSRPSADLERRIDRNEGDLRGVRDEQLTRTERLAEHGRLIGKNADGIEELRRAIAKLDAQVEKLRNGGPK